MSNPVGFDRMKARESIWSSTLSPPQRLVALALVDHADRAGVCFPGAAQLSKRTGLCRRSVLRAVTGLESAGVVTVAKGHGRRARYQFPLVQESHQSARGEPSRVVTEAHQSDPPAVKPAVVPESHRCQRVTGDSESRGGDSESRAIRTTSKPLDLFQEPDQEPDPIGLVFAHWATVLWARFHQRKPKLTPERKSKFEARLRDYSVADLCRAIDAVTESAFHMGANDRGRPYIEPETIFRTASKVDSWLAEKVRRSASRGGPAQPDHGKTGWEE